MTAPAWRCSPAARYLVDRCEDLGLDLRLVAAGRSRATFDGPRGEPIEADLVDTRTAPLEQVLRQLRFDFDALPRLVLGDSKDIRLLTPSIAVTRLLPTVYSFTQNRYGTAPGSAECRARFCADVFRAMAARPGPRRLSSAFLGLIETSSGPLLAEEVVADCNLEVRVKRYHVGSPTHRYRFTDRHVTVGGTPLQRWSRFARPVVCFDWRHPMTDETGRRLADEPVPDDYARTWMVDVDRAKELALDTFLWLEEMFARAALKLVDICFFIDRSGHTVYGEISPDCMRVRDGASEDAEALDKDVWRSGGSAALVLQRYELLYERVGPHLRAMTTLDGAPTSRPSRPASSGM